jgi:hypothetical protein
MDFPLQFAEAPCSDYPNVINVEHVLLYEIVNGIAMEIIVNTNRSAIT